MARAKPRPKRTTKPPSEARERLREDANPREVAKRAQELTPEMLRCRRLRQHKWEPSTARKIRGGWEEVLVCERCTSEKPGRVYNGRGKLIEYGKIDYVEGYLMKGLGRLGEEGRDAINLASLHADMALAGKRRRRAG